MSLLGCFVEVLFFQNKENLGPQNKIVKDSEYFNSDTMNY